MHTHQMPPPLRFLSRTQTPGPSQEPLKVYSTWFWQWKTLMTSESSRRARKMLGEMERSGAFPLARGKKFILSTGQEESSMH